MNYRDQLLQLEKEFGPGGSFNSKSAGFMLDMNIKRASNELHRLYDMGFLNREKRMRPCVINLLNFKKPKFCNKGFEYTYSFSPQGIKYLNWLKNVLPIERMMYEKFISSIMRYATREDIQKFYQSSGSSKFKDSKYPWPMDMHLLILIQQSMAQLESQNDQLTNQNQLLTFQNDRLNKDVSDYKKIPSETFKMAEDSFSAIKSSIDSASTFNDPIFKMGAFALALCKMSVESYEDWFRRRFTVYRILYNLD